MATSSRVEIKPIKMRGAYCEQCYWREVVVPCFWWWGKEHRPIYPEWSPIASFAFDLTDVPRGAREKTLPRKAGRRTPGAEQA